MPDYEPMPAARAAARRTVTDATGLREGGVYLITGGLGGIALGLAGHLARDYRAKLVLLARRGLPPRAEWPAILAAGSSAGGSRRRRTPVG